MPTRRALAALAAFVAVCASARAGADPPADAAVGALTVTTAMRFDGTVDAARVVAAARGQLAPLQRCVALVRQTDRVVGSLNVRLVIGRNGGVQADLESPVNAPARRCLLQGLQAWRLPGVGSGTIMVLLALADAQP